MDEVTEVCGRCDGSDWLMEWNWEKDLKAVPRCGNREKCFRPMSSVQSSRNDSSRVQSKSTTHEQRLII